MSNGSIEFRKTGIPHFVQDEEPSYQEPSHPIVQVDGKSNAHMHDIAGPAPSLEMDETLNDESHRQKQNLKEIENIKKKAGDTNTNDDDVRSDQKKPGNVLDANGNVRSASPQEIYNENKDEKQILPEQNDPHSKFWSNNPGQPFSNTWRPSPKEAEQQDKDLNQGNKKCIKTR
jgi:hypothetical protein